MKFTVLKEVVIEHKYYKKGDTYVLSHRDGDTRYLNALVKHGFMKPDTSKETDGRVPFGQVYYYLDQYWQVRSARDARTTINTVQFDSGNYFTSAYAAMEVEGLIKKIVGYVH